MDNLIINAIIAKQKLSVKEDNETKMPILVNSDNEIIEYDSFEFISIQPTQVRFESGKTMKCDGLLLFGDFTLELHNMDTEDALNWNMFDIKSLELVYNLIKN